MFGVTRQTIASWEEGKTIPDFVTVVKLAEILQVPLEELAYGSEKKTFELGPSTYQFLGTITVGKDGYIKLPKKILRELDVQSGDKLLVVTDRERGIELLPDDILWENTLKKYIPCEKNN